MNDKKLSFFLKKSQKITKNLYQINSKKIGIDNSGGCFIINLESRLIMNNNFEEKYKELKRELDNKNIRTNLDQIL